MDLYLPSFVEAERDALLAEIEAAFDRVGRVGGMSWSQAEVLDMYGTQEDLERARLLDKDTSWQDLLASDSWDPETGIGGWSFLDAVGFRYYLPAAMVLSLRQGWDANILFHLQPGGGDLEAFKRAKWSELDGRQRRCVRRYLDYMLVVTNLASPQAWSENDACLEALDGYWREASGREAADAEAPKGTKRRKRRHG